MCQPNAFPRQRSCRFRGRWISVKTLAFLPKDGRGRSPGRKRANRRYRKGTDLFRPRCARPPSPEPLPSVAGEGFDNRGSRHSCSLFFGPAGPISLKTLHWSVFRALDVPVPSSPRQLKIYACSSACRMSAIRSAESSRPQLMRIMPAGTPAALSCSSFIWR